MHEVVDNRVQILVDARGVIRFVMARRNEESPHFDRKWVLFDGPHILEISAYRADLCRYLRDCGWRVMD